MDDPLTRRHEGGEARGSSLNDLAYFLILAGNKICRTIFQGKLQFQNLLLSVGSEKGRSDPPHVLKMAVCTRLHRFGIFTLFARIFSKWHTLLNTLNEIHSFTRRTHPLEASEWSVMV